MSYEVVTGADAKSILAKIADDGGLNSEWLDMNVEMLEDGILELRRDVDTDEYSMIITETGSEEVAGTLDSQ